MAARQPLRIAVIGGGLGGLYAALTIHHQCGDKVDIHIFEQAAEYKEIGAGVDIGVNAAKLMHKIGLGDQLNSIAGRHADGVWLSFKRHDGKGEIVAVPTSTDNKAIVRQSPVARTELLDMLKTACEERKAAELHTHKRLVKLIDKDGHVDLEFQDGTKDHADLVLGADGIHSNVRAQFVHDKAVYAGRVAYRATIPTSQIDEWWPFGSYSAMWCSKDRHFLVFPISANKTLNVVAFNDVKEEHAAHVVESWVSTCDRSEVEQAYREFEPTVQKIIALMAREPARWRINDREPLDKWHYMDGKVILLGDAAHAMLPHMGSGAGQAIEDGWVLGRALGELLNGGDGRGIADLEACAGLYQKVRLPRAQKVQQKSREAGLAYNMKAGDMAALDYEHCVPLLAARLKKQMQFVWEADIDAVYDEAEGHGQR